MSNPRYANIEEVTGVSVSDRDSHKSKFVPGPLNLLIGDLAGWLPASLTIRREPMRLTSVAESASEPTHTAEVAITPSATSEVALTPIHYAESPLTPEHTAE